MASQSSSLPFVQQQSSPSFLTANSSSSSLATVPLDEKEHLDSPTKEDKDGGNLDRPLIQHILSEGHRLVESSEFGSEQYDNEKNDVHKSASITPRRRSKVTPASMVAFSSSPDQSDFRSCTPYSVSDHGSGSGRGGGGGPRTRNNKPEASSTYSSSTYGTPPSETDTEPRAHPKLVKAGPYLTVAALQAYTILTVVRCLADPTWIVLKTNDDKSGGRENKINLGMIGTVERWCLSFAIAFTMLSCLGVTLRIMDKMAWLRRVPVVCAYFQVLFCITAMSSFLHTQHLPPGAQYSHGFLACVITVVFSSIVAIMLTVDWWRGFPCAGLSATLKALIVSSFMMTIVIIVGAAIYTWLEGWTFDEAVNFCIVSFSTIGYGNLSPRSVAGRIVFFIYGIFGISSIAFFIMSLRNAVIEQFQWRLVERFALPSHLTRVQTRMSAKDLSYPVARFEEEQRVKKVVKRKMIVRMLSIWIVLWFGGAGVFCAFEKWSFLESLYFCYVTLTTIGFGDYVPSEPGSIEFWNIYVFIGLTIFAYILSLFSESMAAHIHLVDDEIVDEDDDMYGWEQCEDPSNNNNGPQFSYRTGLIGMDGRKWIENQQQIHPYQEMQELSVNSGAVAAASVLSQPEQEQNKPHHHHLLHPHLHRPSLSLRFWSQARVQPEASENSAHQQQRQQCQLQQQKQQQQQRPHHMARKSSAGRVLMIPARERQQMLQAEYYATHNGPPMGFQLSDNPVNHSNSNINTNLTDRMANGATSQGQLTESNGAQYGDRARMSMMAPTTIRFVDINGVPHHRTIHGNRRSQILAATHNRHSYTGSIGSASGSLAPTQEGDGFRETSPHPPYHQPYPPSGGGYIIGTEGYQEMMAERRRRRRDTLVSAGRLVPSSLPRSSSPMGHLGGGGGGETLNEVGAGETHLLHDAPPPLPPPPLGTSLSYGGGTTMETLRPQLHRSCFSQNQQVLQTSALDHRPQVKFESPAASPRSVATTNNNNYSHPSPRHLPEAHLYYGRSQIHHDSRDSSSPSPLHQDHSPLFALGESLSPYKDYGVYKMPWPGEEAGGEAEESKHRMLASPFDPNHGHQDEDGGGLAHEEDGHGDHHHHHHNPSLAEADAYRRFMELTHTRQSNASDATKVASPTEVPGSARHHHYDHHESPQYLPHPQQLQPPPPPPQQQQEPPHQQPLDSYFTDASLSRPNVKESLPPWRREGIAPDEVVPPYPASAACIDESITSVGPLDARSPLTRDNDSRAIPPPLSLPSRLPLLPQQQPILREHDDDAIDRSSRVANVATTGSNNRHTGSSNESLGPWDEIRSPDTIPSFQVDVDLNHLDPDPVQVREAQRNRTELFRRCDDIEKRQFSPPPPSPPPPQ